MPASWMYALKSSARRLVSVVTSTRSPLAARCAISFEQMRHLALCGMDFDFRIDQPRRANHLLHNFPAGFFKLDLARRRRDKDASDSDHRFKLFIFQRPIVQRAGQAKTMIDQYFFSLAVPVVHRLDLRQRHV